MKQLLIRIRRMRFTAKIFFLFGLIFLVPLLMLIPYGETEHTFSFLLPALLSWVIGTLIECKNRYRGVPMRFRSREYSTLMMVAIWLFAFIAGGIPFYVSGLLDPLRSIFESASGWTATGFTMLDVTQTPYIFLFYRGLMQLLGGVGFVLLILMFASGSEAMELYAAEGHPDKLAPNLRGTARFIMTMYFGFTIAGMILYMICGMNWFDAINHSMAALATGGFSTRPGGIGYYGSLPIEVVSMVLMLLGGTNFAILSLLIKGNFRKLGKIGEIRFLGLLIALFLPALAFAGLYTVYGSLGESVRVSVFHLVSALTSTGYSTVSFTDWTSAMRLLLIIAMLIGGGAGSTAGGIKYSRVYILYKSFIFRLKEKFMPERQVRTLSIHTPNGKISMSNDSLLNIHHFILVYLITFFIGSLLLCFAGLPLETALFEFSSALGTIGLSTGATSSSSSNFVLVVQIIGMLMARLEVYIVYVFCAAGIRKTAGLFRRRS